MMMGSSVTTNVVTPGNYFNQIVDFLYVGGIQSSETNYKDFGLVVNCTKNICEHVRIPINDYTEECDRFLVLMKETYVLHKINKCILDGIPVLVHCHAGAQRSCALVACYLMKYQHMTLDQAMNHVRKQRTIAFFGGANFLIAMQKFYINILEDRYLQIDNTLKT
jgi:protein-tyrosine phosphatase